MQGLADFLQHLHFRYIQPEDVSLELQLASEMHNTLLPAEYTHFYTRLMPLADLPRLSSFAVAALIGYCLQQLPAEQSYLNIGVWHGFSFFSALLLAPEAHCIGIDNFSEFTHTQPRADFLSRLAQWRQGEHQRFYEMDYREYLIRPEPQPVGLYFYDGAHDYESQYQALALARPWLAPGALILVDDTNESAPRQATLDFMQAHPNCRLLADLRTAHNYHPTFWNGLMILQYWP